MPRLPFQQAPTGPTSRRWTIVWLLFIASLINYLDRSSISLALPLISKDLHLGPESKGVLLSAFFWTYAFMQIPVGWAADRVNLRWLYFFAFVLWSFGQGLTGFATTLGVLILFRLLLGFGESIYLPGGTKIVSLLFASNGARSALRHLRLRHPYGPGAGWPDHPLVAGSLRLAHEFRLDRLYCAVVGDSLAMGDKRKDRSARAAGILGPSVEGGHCFAS